MTCKHRTRKTCLSSDYIQQTLPVTYTYPFASLSHSDTHPACYSLLVHVAPFTSRFLRVPDTHDIESIVSQNSLHLHKLHVPFSSHQTTSQNCFVCNHETSNNDWNARYRMTLLFLMDCVYVHHKILHASALFGIKSVPSNSKGGEKCNGI